MLFNLLYGVLNSISTNIIVKILITLGFIIIISVIMYLWEAARLFMIGFPVVWTIIGYFGMHNQNISDDIVGGDMIVIAVFSFISIITEAQYCKEYNYKFRPIRHLGRGLLFGIEVILKVMVVILNAFASAFGSEGSLDIPSSHNYQQNQQTAQHRGEPEVYKNVYHKDGTLAYRKRMKVGTSGEYYYDEDDGEWHRIDSIKS